MKKFADFANDITLDGDKIKIDDVLDKEVVVLNFINSSITVFLCFCGINSSTAQALSISTFSDCKVGAKTKSDSFLDKADRSSSEISNL